MNDITQAVILCGGLGTRLRPITNSLPKPMVEINKNPFYGICLINFLLLLIISKSFYFLLVIFKKQLKIILKMVNNLVGKFHILQDHQIGKQGEEFGKQIKFR